MTKPRPKASRRAQKPPARANHPAAKADPRSGDAVLRRPPSPPESGDADFAIATEGQRLLARVPGTLASIAAAVGVAKNTVSCWRRGTKVPTSPARAALRDRYGIDPRAWESSPARGRIDLSIGAPPLDPDPEDDELEEADELPEGATTLDEVIAHAAWLRKARHQHGLSASERTKRASTYTQTLRLKAELEDASVSLSDRYWASDVGQAFVRTALAAVRPFPQAAKALADALEAAQR